MLSSWPLAASTPEQAGRVFYSHYQSVQPIANDQAQVIYYRPVNPVQRQGAAHVYIDRQFHTALLPGGYTRFCLAPGTHTLGAYLDDAPNYQGKKSDLYQANLQSGQTYFLRVREDGITFPQPVNREEAELQLKDTRAQVHVISRVDSVEECRHYGFLKSNGQQKLYKLKGDVRFAAGQTSRQYISGPGHAAIRQFLNELRADNAQIKKILITGHTDPLGNVARNEMLAHRRADTVREMMMDAGVAGTLISTESAGSREPVVNTCYGTFDEQVTCYAPNRRVTVEVELNVSKP